MYVRHDRFRDKFTPIYLHVDDLAITGDDIEFVKSQIASRLDMEDLGVEKSVVGILVIRNEDYKYSLNQASLARTILDHFDFNSLRVALTPLPVTLKLYQSTDKEAAQFALEKRPY